jgi:RNase H-fold protein (predicted Holliday junction resolvase)
MTAEFEILSIDPDKKRIGVALVDPASGRSRPTQEVADQAQEAEELREYAERHDAAPSSIGSLADKLRGALKGR